MNWRWGGGRGRAGRGSSEVRSGSVTPCGATDRRWRLCARTRVWQQQAEILEVAKAQGTAVGNRGRSLGRRSKNQNPLPGAALRAGGGPLVPRPSL